MNKKRINGIIVPLVTPLTQEGDLDATGLERLVEHVIAGGVHGIFILGTTGEAQSLSIHLREEMIRLSAHLINKRVPMLVGISDTSLAESVRLAKVAEINGAAAVVSAPPYYYAPGQSELIDYYAQLIPELGIPLYLYNMPSHTKVSFAPETVKTIARNKKVIGFKDSSANGTYFQTVSQVMRKQPDFSLFVGPEEMTAEAVLMGANGGVNGGANMFPALYVELYKAAKAGDIAKARELQELVMEVSTRIYTRGENGSSYLMGLKCALSVLGICHDYLAMPYSHFDAGTRALIKKSIDELGEMSPLTRRNTP